MLLCACGAKNSLVGTWAGEVEGVSVSMTFNEDKTGSMSIMGGLMTVGFTYTDDNGKVVMTPEEDKEDYMSFTEFEYSVSGNTLTLTDDEGSIVLTKQ